MEFHYVTLDTCSEQTGLVVVIDVLRAFTSAAFALAGGAQRVIPISTVEEGLELKRRNPGWLACGEIGGQPPPGFDVGNSPTHLLEMDLTGRTLIQRTSAGTQGLVRCRRADILIAASFVVTEATVRYILSLCPERVTFLPTGRLYDGGVEDLACAEYLEARLEGETPDPEPFLERVRGSHDAEVLLDPARPEFPESDLTHATSLDKFDFAMPVVREEAGLVIRKFHP